MTAPRPSNGYIEFENFRFDPDALLLFRNDEIVDVTPKALELLCVLIDAEGRPVTKQELIERVWPNSFVEEANLSYNIFKLRRALGEEDGRKFIETLPKRGYRFVSTITRSSLAHEERLPPEITTPTAPFRRNYLYGGAVAVILLIAVGGSILLLNPFGRRVEAIRKASFSNPTFTQLTTLHDYACAAISPDGKFVAYGRNWDNADGSLRVRQTTSAVETQLLAPGRRMFGTIAFTPDSQSVVYAVGNADDEKWSVFKIPVLGGQPAHLITLDDNIFTMSPDGKSVLSYRFDRAGGKTDLLSTPLDGSSPTVLYSRAMTEMLFDGVPSLSPDGRHLAFAADAGQPLVKSDRRKFSMYLLELASGTLSRVSEDEWRGVGTVSWMHDGTGVVMAASRKPDGNQLYYVGMPSGPATQITKEYGIFGNFGVGLSDDGRLLVGDRSQVHSTLWKVSLARPTSEPVQLSNGECDGTEGVALMPNGDVVYNTKFRDDHDIWLLSQSGGKKEGRPLTSDAFYDGDPAAAPDGKQIVFASDRAGGRHLFAIQPDGSGLRQLTSGQGRDDLPDFSPDGLWIYYSSQADDESRIWRIPAIGGEPERVTNFESVAPSVSPDGKMIALVTPSDNTVGNSTLSVVSALDGTVIKSFGILPYSYRYGHAQWTEGGRSVIVQGTGDNLTDLFEQQLDGSPVKQLTHFKDGYTHFFAYDPAKKRLVVAREHGETDVVLLRNSER